MEFKRDREKEAAKSRSASIADATADQQHSSASTSLITHVSDNFSILRSLIKFNISTPKKTFYRIFYMGNSNVYLNKIIVSLYLIFFYQSNDDFTEYSKHSLQVFFRVLMLNLFLLSLLVASLTSIITNEVWFAYMFNSM